MLFVASWYGAVFVKSMESIMRVTDNMTYLWHRGTELFWRITSKIPYNHIIDRACHL